MGRGWINTIKEENARKRGKIFTKIAKEIAVAAKLGGPDPEANARLKLAILTARENSCPKDTIERAIKKGSGQLDDGSTIEELTYEGFGPFGVGVIVEAQTDNKNRTVSEIRTIFKSHGGNLGESGSVAWMFQRVSLIQGTKQGVGDPEEEAIEVGANEVDRDGETQFSFWGSPDDLDAIRKSLSSRGWSITAAELSYKPSQITDLKPEERAALVELLSELEDFDDTHRVHATIK